MPRNNWQWKVDSFLLLFFLCGLFCFDFLKGEGLERSSKSLHRELGGFGRTWEKKITSKQCAQNVLYEITLKKK